MTNKENITAILECYFPGFKKEIIDSACNRIIRELDCQGIFHKGYEHGRKDVEKDAIPFAIENGKIIGREEAWKCARQIVGDVVDPHFESGYMVDIFRCESAITAVMNNSVDDVIAKIKEYEEKQKRADNEIEVGDEVVDGEVFNSGKGIVTFASPVLLYVLWYDGSTGRRKLADVKKTGRHFDKIAEVLEQLKEEEK